MHRDEIDALIGGVMAGRPTAHWQSVLEVADVPVAPVQTIAQAVEHPQTAAIHMLQPVPESAMRLMATPVRFDGARPPIRHAAPELNADAAILAPFRKTPSLQEMPE